MKNNDTSFLVGFVLGIVALIVFAPLATIWSLNTLFALAIPYNFATWFAAFWLTAVFTAKVSKQKG